MSSFDVYCYYIAMKLHFSDDNNYDFHKFNGQVKKLTPDTYTKRKDVRMFKLFFKRRRSDWKFFMLSAFASGIKDPSRVYILDLLENEEFNTEYNRFSKYHSAMYHYFESDMQRVIERGTLNEILKWNKDEPCILLNMWQEGDVNIETITILNDLLGFIDKKNIHYEWYINIERACSIAKKYRGFISYDKDKILTIIRDCMAC